MGIVVEVVFWLSAFSCGIAVGMLVTGGRKWWLVVGVSAAVIGGMSIVIKSSIENPEATIYLLKRFG